MSGEVISASIETSLELPPTPEGLVQLSGTFDKAGYVRLARYLRACGDALSAKHRACACAITHCDRAALPLLPVGDCWVG